MSELYELPSGWKWSTLSDVCNLLNGFAFKAKEYIDSSNTVIIRMGNIRPNGQFDPEHKIKYLPNKYATELSKYILNEGDLIIAMTDLATEMRILGNPTLVSNLSGRTFLLNQRVGKLYDFKYEKIVIEYLRYIITAPQVKDYYKSLGGGGLQINIGKQQILSASFPLPPLQEQKRIVAKLDNLFEKIDKSIALHQKNMDEADVFMGSVLNDVFVELEKQYGKTSISSVMKINNQTIVPDDNEMYNYVGLENIESNSGKLVDYVPSIGKDIKSSKVHFKKGMVLYGKLRPYLNKVWIADFDGIATTEILPFFPIDNSLSMEYVKHYFLSPKYLEKVMSNCSGARMPRLTTKFIKSNEAYIPIPSLKIQKKTVTYLDEISQKIEKIKSVQKEKMKSLVALKASILDQAFRGEL